MTTDNIYAAPMRVTDPAECVFYHTMDVPGYGVIPGNWDLRGSEEVYLGNVDFSGKRVLDAGTSTGFLTFHMEKKGAEVVSYDLSKDFSWDVVPLVACDHKAFEARNKLFMQKVNNGYWFCHNAYKSKAKVVYGTIYGVPREIGMVDISVVGMILEHLRDPFLALENVLRLTKETVIIAEVYPKPTMVRRILNGLRLPFELMDAFTGPQSRFVPDAAKSLQGVWWYLWPELLRKMIGVLGFEETVTTYHWQKYEGRKWRSYTIVGRRTRDHYDY
jgi:SAM-dependent methyltransferase